ncbi:unnamed protein product [Gongylonema pulchrum]|uniref:Uncharacterized protein n=1 Tax=Gongylonema pulchrum TaxID=637853 RepID=A0A183DUX2_9BILA|nr:unnamed protein product [Gongylonema pulchrum]
MNFRSSLEQKAEQSKKGPELPTVESHEDRYPIYPEKEFCDIRKQTGDRFEKSAVNYPVQKYYVGTQNRMLNGRPIANCLFSNSVEESEPTSDRQRSASSPRNAEKKTVTMSRNDHTSQKHYSERPLRPKEGINEIKNRLNTVLRFPKKTVKSEESSQNPEYSACRPVDVQQYSRIVKPHPPESLESDCLQFQQSKSIRTNPAVYSIPIKQQHIRATSAPRRPTHPETQPTTNVFMNPVYARVDASDCKPSGYLRPMIPVPRWHAPTMSNPSWGQNPVNPPVRLPVLQRVVFPAVQNNQRSKKALRRFIW